MKKGIPARNGGTLNPGGTPGHRGGPGRPKEEFLEWCREAASSQIARDRILNEIATAEPFPAKLWEKIAHRGYGMPTQQVDLNAKLMIQDDT